MAFGGKRLDHAGPWPTLDTSDAEQDDVFTASLAHRRLHMVVIGLGYTGLPLAVALAQAGFRVTGYDHDPARVARLAVGRSYIPDVPSEALAVATGFTATTDEAGLADGNVFLICVPTPAMPSGTADLRHVEAATGAVARNLTPGSIVIIQSTVPPGTTRLLADKLAAETGLAIGREFSAAHAPERIDPANRAGWTLRNTPKLVAGVTGACTRRAAAVLRQVVDEVVVVGSVEVAETAKVFENTFRLVNIALVTQLADVCAEANIPVRAVIDAAGTKPFGFLRHYPGAGVGGDCIAVDPMFLSSYANSLESPMSLVDEAFATVRARPRRVVARVRQILREQGRPLTDARVVIAGVSYKPDVSDARNAPATAIAHLLAAGGVELRYCDPYVDRLVVGSGRHVAPVDWDALGADTDLVVLATAHSRFLEHARGSHFPPVLDCCYALAPGPGVFHL